MDERRGLGRGLTSIFQELQQQQSFDQKRAAAVELSIEDVAPNPKQPRHYFDEQAMEELRASIAREGVLQPILVRKMMSTERETYQIIAGERRWRASKLANRLTIPAVIIECDDLAALQLGLVENLQRDGLSPLEEASSIWTLVNEFGQKQDDVASLLSKSRSYVSNSLRLLRLPESVQEMIQKKLISAGHARALIDAEDAEALAKRIIEEELSVRDVENAVRPQKPSRQSKPRPPRETKTPDTIARDPDLVALEESLTSFLKVPVKILPLGDGGVIQIQFKDYNALDDIIGTLKARQPNNGSEDKKEDDAFLNETGEAPV